MATRVHTSVVAMALLGGGCGPGHEAPPPALPRPPEPASAPARPTPAPAETAPERHVQEDTKEAAPRTFCKSVAHLGDSTSTGMMSPNYVRDPAQRLDAQYARVGVERLELDHVGGRSLVEHSKRQQNGVQAAAALRERGFAGCWVVALGTNDAANAAKDPTVPPPRRVERLMAVIGEEPVLWIDAATRATAGYWAEANMLRWNEDLTATLRAYPNARLYRWSEHVRDEWYVSDGIHFTSAGYTARAAMVADALAAAFPAPAGP